MAEYDVAPLSELIDKFAMLPGIGRKTAQRLAFFMLDLPKTDAEAFASAILVAKEKIHTCSVCQNLTDKEICSICSGENRDRSTVCVVESPKDVIAIEHTREYTGLYHVLHGLISPMDGIGPEQLRVKELIERVGKGGIEEVIMATNSTVEGEATAIYLSKLLKPLGVRVTRLAYGIPVGTDLQYADDVTLSRAIEGRSEL